jgi:hypothetical protein
MFQSLQRYQQLGGTLMLMSDRLSLESLKPLTGSKTCDECVSTRTVVESWNQATITVAVHAHATAPSPVFVKAPRTTGPAPEDRPVTLINPTFQSKIAG